MEIVTNSKEFTEVTTIHLEYLFNSGARWQTELLAGKDTMEMEGNIIVIKMGVSGATHRIANSQIAMQTDYQTKMMVPIRGKQECRVCGQRTMPEYELCSKHGGVSEARPEQA